MSASTHTRGRTALWRKTTESPEAESVSGMTACGRTSAPTVPSPRQQKIQNSRRCLVWATVLVPALVPGTHTTQLGTRAQDDARTALQRRQKGRGRRYSSSSFLSSSSFSQISPNPTTSFPDLSTHSISVQTLPRDRSTLCFSSDPQLIFHEPVLYVLHIAMIRVCILLILIFILASIHWCS